MATQDRKLPLGKIEPNSLKYFLSCGAGGIIGPTHTAVTPLDLVKCRRQVDPKIYTSNLQAWRTIFSKEGLRGVFFGWSPTFLGYSFQGAGKYGLYEYFKHLYGNQLFPETNRTLVFLGASASAEFFADMALCPMEAIKVRMQTTLPPYASGLREGWGKIVAKEGFGGLYKGLYPLWARQIPYTMTKFATFEETVKIIYSKMGKPKEEYGQLTQTGVSFLGGYIAGIFCAVVSHPADVMVSKLNADRKAGEGALTAVSRIYGNIGFSGLWNGLPVRIVMLGTLTGFQWLIYDSFKVFLAIIRIHPSLRIKPNAQRIPNSIAKHILPPSSPNSLLKRHLPFQPFTMEASRPHTSIPPANPPSVEIAYKRKCIALKKRLAEVEAENELMRTRNRRGTQYIQKMRLETCMLLERLTKVTGMADEAKSGASNPELRARAAAMMSTTQVDSRLEDDTEGSSDEQPRTPEERPLRVKRSRKSAAAGLDGDEEIHHEGHPESVDPSGAALPRLAPAPTQESLTHSFRVQTGSGGSADQTPVAGDGAVEAEVGPETGTTPMDMDKEEVKEEPKIEQP
ncbi:unnamed protein product [Penicillium olsonii]|uniref:INO80 complex subunit F domain-containing protein n=1 Tax=Penicillium olsonii TaxID=99116 RepID=A0A9W4H9J8_PENOL|nr:unnamed protein product [Penicillium olsonii]CAG8266399.1 unnamed protein product [Penicillium olsonii]